MAASAQIDAFEKITDAGKWPSVKRADVVAGLRARLRNKNSIAQRDSPNCGPASFFRTLLIDDEDTYVRAATELYDSGTTTIGQLKITPGAELLKSPVKYKMAAVDFITLLSLRDSDNTALSSAGWFGGNFAGVTVPSTLLDWFKAAGYTDTASNTFLTQLTKPGSPIPSMRTKKMMDIAQEATNKLSAGYRVMLFVDSDLIEAKATYSASPIPNHWIMLESGIVWDLPDIDGAAVNGKMWTWGWDVRDFSPNPAEPVQACNFALFFYGYVAVKRPSDEAS
jgi:hypothetical protein